MFKFLKEKLKNVVKGFSEKAQEPEEEIEKKLEEEEFLEEKQEVEQEPLEVAEAELEDKEEDIEEEKEAEEVIEEIAEEEGVLEEKKEVEQPTEKPKTLFSRFTSSFKKTTISQKKFDELFDDLEMILLENNVALEVIDKIRNDLSNAVVDKQLTRGKLEESISHSLKSSIEGLFFDNEINLLEAVKQKKPFVICFIGVNGAGKTTTIAKFVQLFKDNNLSSVIAASDTFRAAAIDQLQLHADKLNVKMIRHDYGSDPAAVAFDAIKHAEAKGVDVVLIDTAGRMHSNTNLMDEMKKVVRVANPDLKIFIGESITGNDCVEQAKAFNEAVGIDGIVLSKADIDEKGGAAISISYVTKKPIMYIGTGQEYSDLTPFDPKIVIEGLGLEG